MFPVVISGRPAIHSGIPHLSPSGLNSQASPMPPTSMESTMNADHGSWATGQMPCAKAGL